MGFCLWEPQSKRVLCSRDVYFNEDKMHKKPIKIVEIHRGVFQEDGQVHNRQLDNAPVARERREELQEQQVVQLPMLRRSTRESRAPDRYVPSLDYVMLADCEEPSYYQEAMLRDDKLEWEQAMQSEMDLLHKKATWTWYIYQQVREHYHASGFTS